MSKESKINKESRTVLLKGKKGQLTIFIALGIIILFIFIFLIQFNQKLVKAKLETSQEDVLSKTFKKEALRIFVEDCLRDELRSAILLIGKQGRVWNAQPGGKEAFAEGVNGIYISEEDLEISYALTRKNYLSSVNAYPCLDESNPSFFCKYAYPGINVKFGEVQRWEFFWEKEIESYLKATAQKCIDDYLKEHAKGAIFQPKDFNLDVDLQEGGVLVDAFYPLGFKLGNEDFFHLSVFDFFYPTKLKKMLRASFFYPLEMDWRYVDFNYSSETLQQNSFQVVGIDGSALILPTYSQDVHNLEITTDRKRMANGDTIFTFKSPFPHILDTPEEFILNIARQNRAPALDYIHRGECTEAAQSYDYLVVRGDEQYGDIDILLQARDPDEDIADDDQIKYWIESTDSFINSHIYDSPNPSGTSPSATSTQPGPTGSGILGNYLYADQEEILTALPLGNYELTAFAKDKYGQQDYQTVKIAVDRSIESDAEVDVQISLPYKVRSGTGLVDYASVGDAYYISPEDPVVVGVKMPEFSTLSEVELSKVTYVS
ncbi:hypothetical protein HYX12_02670 [Candidatus Woesearchaeota archaeon]|nr:hypothetical protein [Candidatus Woesearchaeota archaeon]